MSRQLRRMAVAALVAVVGVAGLTAPAASAAVAPPKSIVVTASPSTAVYSQAVKLTVAITPRGGGAPKGGTVTFLDGETPVGTATATARSTSVTTTALGVGSHSIRASYSGDAVAGPSTSAPVTVTVGAAPTATTLRSGGPVTEGERAELKAVVLATAPASASRRPTGTVTFTRGSTQATVALNANGVATWRPLLPVGDHAVTAVYDGSGTHAPSAPASATQTVAAVVVPEPVVDQQWTDSPGGPGVLEIDDRSDGAQMRAGQTWTSGMTGALAAIDIMASTSGTDPLHITIQTVGTSNAPTGEVVGTATLAATTGTAIHHVALDAPVPVETGLRYAMVFDVEKDETGAAETTWVLPIKWAAEGDGNSFVESSGGGPWSRIDFFDLAYRTWVLPAVD